MLVKFSKEPNESAHATVSQEDYARGLPMVRLLACHFQILWSSSTRDNPELNDNAEVTFFSTTKSTQS